MLRILLRKTFDDQGSDFIFSIIYVSRHGWHERRLTMWLAIAMPHNVGRSGQFALVYRNALVDEIWAN